jgi:hypothetical protein
MVVECDLLHHSISSAVAVARFFSQDFQRLDLSGKSRGPGG